jgi:hypothetical protein
VTAAEVQPRSITLHMASVDPWHFSGCLWESVSRLNGIRQDNYRGELELKGIRSSVT